MKEHVFFFYSNSFLHYHVYEIFPFCILEFFCATRQKILAPPGRSGAFGAWLGPPAPTFEASSVKHASSPHTFGRCARARVGRSAKITVSIDWTVPSNFCFLAHPQKMHGLKDITRARTFTRFVHASEHVRKKIRKRKSCASSIPI